jgi:hypothetical protein
MVPLSDEDIKVLKRIKKNCRYVATMGMNLVWLENDQAKKMIAPVIAELRSIADEAESILKHGMWSSHDESYRLRDRVAAVDIKNRKILDEIIPDPKKGHHQMDG